MWNVSIIGTLSMICTEIQLCFLTETHVVRSCSNSDFSLLSNKNTFYCVYSHVCKTQPTRIHATDTSATPNGHQMAVATFNRSICTVHRHPFPTLSVIHATPIYRRRMTQFLLKHNCILSSVSIMTFQQFWNQNTRPAAALIIGTFGLRPWIRSGGLRKVWIKYWS